MSIPNPEPKLFTPRRRNVTFLIGFICGIVVTALVFGLASLGGKREENADEGTPEMARRLDGDPLAMGPVDAPLTIVEYADFRCPFCSLFMADRFPQIKEEYIDTGLVRFEYRDLPSFGEDSVAASVAARAAGNQGKFWEFSHEVALHGVAEGGHPALPRETLVGFAEKAGVPDIDRFTADLDDPELLNAVRSDAQEGHHITQSVPTFFIGSTMVPGAQEMETFREIIDQELKAKGVER